MKNRPSSHITLKEQLQQPSPTLSRKTTVCFAIIVFMWPAIYLSRDIIPIRETYTAIDNDFGGVYYPYKAYLLAGLAQGHFPLWSPSEAAGYPLFPNPIAQAFYPLNLLLIPYYILTGGYTLLDYQIFTVLGLCIFSLGLYVWLRLILLNPRAALFGALIMSVSFKMTEIVRFPNAVHSAAWYPWILYAVTKLFLSKTNKETLLNAAIFIFSVVCLCTAGYPYYIYYSVFLFPVYFCIFLWPFLRRQLFGNMKFQIKRGTISTAAAGIIASCICGPYLAAVAELMSQTVNRGGKNFAYSTAYIFNLQDTIGSLIYPPFAQAEGWYFFSITALLILLIYIFSFPRPLADKPNRNKTLRPENLEHPKTIATLFLLGWIAVISYISYGKDSVLFKLLWHSMPCISSLRVWGRLSIILIPLFAWLLSWAYLFYETLLYGDDTLKRNRIKAVIVITIGYTIIIIAQSYFYRNNMLDPYWRYFPNLSGCRIYFIVFGLGGYLTILLLILLRRQLHHPFLSYLPMLFLLLAAVVEMWPVGANTWVEKNAKIPQKINLNIADNNSRSFTIPRLSNYGTISLLPVFHVGILPNWDFARYVAFLRQTQNEGPFQNILLGATKNPRRVFISESLHYNTIQSFLNDSLRFNDVGQMQSYTGDELVWEVTMPTNGYFSFIDNWDPYWKVYVDDKEEKIELLFGTFKSVHLTQGKHKIIFRYEPTLRAVLFGAKQQ